MDRRTLVLVALCLVLFMAYPLVLQWIGLGHYLSPTPPRPAGTDSAEVAAPDTAVYPPAAPVVRAAPRAPAAAAAAADTAGALESAAERRVLVETALYRAEFSTRGARLVGLELKHYASAYGPMLAGGGSRPRAGEPLAEADRVRLIGDPSFALDLGSGDARRGLDARIYDLAESLDASGRIRALHFTRHEPGGAMVRQTYRIREDDYAIDLEVEIRGVPLEWRVADYTLTARSWPLDLESDHEDEERSLKASSLVGTNHHHEGMGGLKKGPKTFDGAVVWTAVQTRYFAGAIAIVQGTAKSAVAALDSRPLSRAALARVTQRSRATQDVAVSSMVVSLPGDTQPVNRFLLFFGPNEHRRLAALGHDLDRIVDLGWTWIRPLSQLLLVLMLWLHTLVRNYGVAIIVLATLVRVVLHPLSMMSIKSMRSMQRLQPEMERIRAKYKNDTQALNTAMMALYKQHKINPAGGCLPMLVQMPLFIALYSVLFNAIELRQAPFLLWMQDLSAPDTLFRVAGFPIRLLPLLMTVSGFIQQKVTPTDPRQASTFYLMNVLMLVFFYNLPSGLVLYWTVMNLLTALQQWIALREDGEAPVVASQVTRKVARK